MRAEGELSRLYLDMTTQPDLPELPIIVHRATAAAKTTLKVLPAKRLPHPVSVDRRWATWSVPMALVAQRGCMYSSPSSHQSLDAAACHEHEGCWLK